MKQKLKIVYIPVNGEVDLGVCYFSRFDEWTLKENVEEQELITFTPEEYNQHVQDIIKNALDTAADYADTEFCGNMYDPEDNTQCINRGSITNTFEETFKKYKL